MGTNDFVNYYEILEIDSKATDDQIREAVKRQRRTWIKRQQAPSLDVRREAEDRVLQIDAAETNLLDVAMRKAFDQRLASYVPPAPSTQSATDGMDWLARAKTFLELGDINSASYAAKQATDHQASHHEAWAVRARSSFLAGKDQDAIFEYNEALRIQPQADEYHFDLGSVYESKGQDKIALTCYERAAQLAPTNPLYQVSISSIYLDNNLPEKALPILEKVHSAHPDVDEFNFYLAAALNEVAVNMWTSVGSASVITQEIQIGPSKNYLSRASQLKFKDPTLRQTINHNLKLVSEAETMKFRIPGWTATKKVGIGASSMDGGIFNGCLAGGCTAYILLGLIFGGIGVAFHANPFLGILVLAGVGFWLYKLAYRPGWKWNQIDSRGVIVTKNKSLGQRIKGPH